MNKHIINCFSFNIVGDISEDELSRLNDFFILCGFKNIANYFYIFEVKSIVDIVVIIQHAAKKYPWFKTNVVNLKFLRCTDIDDLSSIL